MKYLYPYECEKRRLSTPQELQAAIDGNRREGRRSSYGTYAEMVQRNPAAAGGGGGGGGLVGAGLGGGLPGGVQLPSHPAHPGHPGHGGHPAQMGSPLSLVPPPGRLMNGNGHYNHNHNHQLLAPPGAGESHRSASPIGGRGGAGQECRGR